MFISRFLVLGTRARGSNAIRAAPSLPPLGQGKEDASNRRSIYFFHPIGHLPQSTFSNQEQTHLVSKSQC
ncbi:hypothetical protein WAI453_000443 [Rhynchosporium graminicola]